MSRKGQFSFLLAFLTISTGLGLKVLLNLEIPYYTIILWSLFGLFFISGLFFERSMIIDFLSMKTTKHGMNMGSTIILVCILLIAFNYISYSHNKKWDLTQEKLNSLSPQTIQILDHLDHELQIIGFFKEASQDIQQSKAIFLDVTDKMRFENPKIKVETYDPDRRPDLKGKYGVSSLGDVVILYNGKQKLISILNLLQPEEAEETLLNNIYSLSYENGKSVYILTGHGEPSPTDTSPRGISFFSKSLEDLNYEIKTLNLIETEKIPKDAQMVLVIGPKTKIFDGEINSLKEYLKNGGRLLIAADPGEKHNISQLTETFGVHFLNNYIIDFTGMRVAGTQYLAVGLSYPSQSGITKGFKTNTNFNITSEVLFKEDSKIHHEVLVGSSPQSIVRKELLSEIQLDPKLDIPKSRNIAVLSEGTIDSSDKNFKAIVYGDSDFINNNDIQVSMMNRDLILNSIAYLADQKELLSIRPKKLKLSAFFITESQTVVLAALYILFPLLCFVAGVVIWYRKRHS